jgi:hypothetical protein
MSGTFTPGTFISGTVDLFLSRVDRDRDIWSDGLYEFIERVRFVVWDFEREMLGLGLSRRPVNLSCDSSNGV